MIIILIATQDKKNSVGATSFIKGLGTQSKSSSSFATLILDLSYIFTILPCLSIVNQYAISNKKIVVSPRSLTTIFKNYLLCARCSIEHLIFFAFYYHKTFFMICLQKCSVTQRDMLSLQKPFVNMKLIKLKFFLLICSFRYLLGYSFNHRNAHRIACLLIEFCITLI